MGVCVVTDSVADLPAEVAGELGILVVPLGVHFGQESGEGLDPDAFYERLIRSDPLPTTSAPTPETYAAAYREATNAGEDVFVVTLSSRLSATYEVALKAKELVTTDRRIEVFDSRMATLAQGFVVIEAAKAARGGADLKEVAARAQSTRPRVGFVAAFDTLEYLRRGGRIGAAKALLGSLLNVQPLVTMRDGVVAPYGRARSRKQAISRLVEYARAFRAVDALAIEHTACPADADDLRLRLRELFPQTVIYESRATPVIGTHTGPGLLVLSVMGE